MIGDKIPKQEDVHREMLKMIKILKEEQGDDFDSIAAGVTVALNYLAYITVQVILLAEALDEMRGGKVE